MAFPQKSLDIKNDPVTYRFASETWATDVARLISESIRVYLSQHGYCNVVLTGGRSAAKLYLAWGQQADFQCLTGVNFYFGDERCVSPSHPESNYGMAMRTLFQYGIPNGCQVIPMYYDALNSEISALKYETLLPSSVDILLLSVGDDGHIASLFPHRVSLGEVKRRVLQVRGDSFPYNRLTITRSVIDAAKIIYVMACGEEKNKILNQLTDHPDDYMSIPARLAICGVWITDR